MFVNEFFNKKTVAAEAQPNTGTRTVSSSTGTTTYDAAGKATQHATPRLGGMQKTTDLQTGRTTTSVDGAGISASQSTGGGITDVTSATMDLGSGTASVHRGVGFGGAGKDVQGPYQGSITNTATGATTNVVGRLPTRQDMGVEEGSAQDRLHRRHQELRKKSGLPDPEYYRELKASYDIEDDAKRIATQAEIKKKYRVAEGAAEKVLSKMVPGAGSAINAVDAVRRYKSGDKVGAGIAAAGIVPLVSYPALATDVVRDKMNTGRWLPSDEERDLANLNSQIEKMEKTSWQELPGGYKRSPDKQTISGPVTKVAPEPKSKSVPDSMQPDSESLPSRPYPEKQVTNEDIEGYLEEMRRAGYDIVTEAATLCPECGGPAYNNQMLAEKQDACYHKVKSRYKVWPSAYASGALVRCRKAGAKNWGNKSKK